MIDIYYRRTPNGLQCIATHTGPDGRRMHGVANVEGYGEVGSLGRGLKRLARSKALRSLGRTAMQVAKQTPYGRAANRALRGVRTALGREGSRGRRRPSPRGRGSTSRLSLNPTQRLEVARRILASGLTGRGLVRALRAVLDV